jgi:hypothetical protein
MLRCHEIIYMYIACRNTLYMSTISTYMYVHVFVFQKKKLPQVSANS